VTGPAPWPSCAGWAAHYRATEMWDRDLGLDAIHQEEHRPCSIEQSRARVSQSDATPVPDEEWRAKLLLEAISDG
jgi:hypothetical protein